MSPGTTGSSLSGSPEAAWLLRPKPLAVVGERVVTYRLAQWTIKQRVGLVKRMFKWASSVELIPVAVYEALATVEGLKSGRSEAPEPRKMNYGDSGPRRRGLQGHARGL